jgi:hypothetical protein
MIWAWSGVLTLIALPTIWWLLLRGRDDEES